MSGPVELQRACVEYFKKNPAFRPFLLALRKKWKHYGRSAGVIVLKKAGSDEREALNRFLGQSLSGPDLRISVQAFEAALGETKFSGVTVEELLTGYFHECMEKNKTVQERTLEQRRNFFTNLAMQEKGAVEAWLHSAWQNHCYGYRLLMEAYRQQKAELTKAVLAIGRVHAILPQSRKGGSSLRLAVVSAEVSGNPHYFDIDRLEGKLLLSFLSFCQNREEPRSAEERLELYYRSGLRPDDMSSLTFLYGIHLHLADKPHPAYEAFIQLGEAYAVTLLNLDAVVGASCMEKNVYVVENQTVFSDLCANAPFGAALMCTSGQLRTASLIVLDMLAQADYRIYYSGDLDPEGMRIADRLIRRYPGQVVPWHMGRTDYEDSVSGELLSSARLKQMERLEDPVLRDTACIVRTTQAAAYQERLLPLLKEDVVNTNSDTIKL